MMYMSLKTRIAAPLIQKINAQLAAAREPKAVEP